MFFGNSRGKDEKIEQLNKQIQELESQVSKTLQDKSTEINRINSDTSTQIAKLQNENKQLKNIASFSTEEAIIAIDRDNNIIFLNDRAKENIKNPDAVIKSMLSGENRVIVEDCEAKIQVKRFDDISVVSLTKTTIHDDKDNGLLHKHNLNMNQSLSSTQNVYVDLLEELESMAKESKQTSSGSKEGLELTQNIVKDTQNLNAQIVTENEIVTNLVQKSDDIAGAITVIDQIAFQTNILSLNAAVEAATAGEAGKGFAVVAQEVRNLASRSAEAAKEIKTLVENAATKANEGKKVSDEMIQGYETLNTNTSETIHLIEDVSAASKEQMTGIEQINDSVTMLDRVTQENAHEADAVAQIAHDVSKLANELVSDASSKKFN